MSQLMPREYLGFIRKVILSEKCDQAGDREKAGTAHPMTRQNAEYSESRARTHMANERTFLAWLRTGITLIALGLAAAQFLTHDLIPGVPLTRVIASVVVVSGMFVTVAGARRYFLSCSQIEAREYRPAMRAIVIAVGLIVLVGLMSLVFVFALRR